MEKATQLWYLEQFNILKHISKKEKEQLAEKTHMKKYSKGDIIYVPSDKANNIYFLKSGKIKISQYSEDGREFIKTILGQGEIFGEMALMGEEYAMRDEIAEAIEDCIICSINENEFSKFLSNNPNLNLRIFKLIGFRLKKVEKRLESLYFKTSAQRVNEFIKDLADNYGRKIGVGHEYEVKMNLTHEEIAKITANSRQSVTTILRNLEKEGVISYNRRRILVKNYKALNQ